MTSYNFRDHMLVTYDDGSGQLRGHSPFREDKNPSFSANTVTGLWKDHGTQNHGNWDQFCDQLQIEKAQVLSTSSHTKKKTNTDFWNHARPTNKYYYQDQNNKTVYRKTRFESVIDGEKRKQFTQEHLQNEKWELGKTTNLLFPFMFEKVPSTAKEIFWVEGERCCEFLNDLGIFTVTSHEGSSPSKNQLEFYAKIFEGKSIYILPDNDKPGLSCAQKLAQCLGDKNLVKIIHLELKNTGEDVVEWFELYGGTKEILLEKCHIAKPFEQVQIVEAAPPKFKSPLSLPPVLPFAEPIDESLIPEPLKVWVLDAADRMNVCPEFILMPFLTSVSSLIGRRLCIKPKKHDPWYEVNNLWCMIVGAPSTMKSPSLGEALCFLNEKNKDYLKKYRSETEERQPKIQIIKAKIKAYEKEIRKALDEDRETLQAEQNLEQALVDLKELEPKLKKLTVNDSTVEKLCELLELNPNGLLIFRDELSGWLSNLAKQGREGDREFFLESWNGKNSYNVERIMRGSHFVEALRVAIVGGIQPAKLSTIVADILKGGSGADGLFDRFQLAVYPPQREWVSLIDRKDNQAAKNRVKELFAVIDDADFKSFNLELSENIPALRFSDEAQIVFNDWYSKLELKLRHPSTTALPQVESHLGKFRSLVPKLAVIFEVIGWADIQRLKASGIHSPLINVSQESLSLAIHISVFLEKHAHRIYALGAERGLRQAHALAEKIRSFEIKDMDTVRTISRHHWSGLNTIPDVEIGLSILEKLNWITLNKVSKGGFGRPSEFININPNIFSNPLDPVP